jgi:hypothetical protein
MGEARTVVTTAVRGARAAFCEATSFWPTAKVEAAASMSIELMCVRQRVASAFDTWAADGLNWQRAAVP